MKTFEIGYLTDDPAADYSKAIRLAENKEALVETITYYKVIAQDALKAAKKLTDQDFVDLKRMLKKSRRIKGAEAEEFVRRFGDIVMPIKMTMASLIAEQFHAPWGTAWIRCEEEKWPMLNPKK